MNSPNTYLITGGVRSGKSKYALKLAEIAQKPFYLATGWAGDEEMVDRILKHQEERDSRWTTIEERIDMKKAIIAALEKNADCIIIDCMTMWVTNIMYSGLDLDSCVAELSEALMLAKIPVVIVTNEVGLGVVPSTKDGRDFRDMIGIVNQKLAKVVDRVILMVAGLPMVIK